MSTLAQRSHRGCWTCKSRRRKCDRARPTCHACEERGLLCEGYEMRLRWGSGIASRGRFTGADAPVEASIPPRAKGRQRDRSRERQRQMQPTTSGLSGENTDSNPSLAQSSFQMAEAIPDDAQLFQEFLSSGINILHSTSVHDPEDLLRTRLPTLCRESEALYVICVTLQASLTPSCEPRFFEYFDAALNKFRNELSRSEAYLEDGTLAAGLLLCTIGVMHGISWTMHLRGMHNILHLSSPDALGEPKSAFRAHLFEVMGYMDLPTFAIGRQYPYLGFWRQYCRSQNSTRDPSREYDIEVVSGLPRSLVDILSCIDAGAREEDFWDWPGAQGNFPQCQLWEAYRLAGILSIRHGKLHLPSSLVSSEVQPWIADGNRRLTLPSSAVIVSRLLSCVDAIYRASLEPEGKDALVINAILYPVFVAGLQTEILEKDPTLKDFIRKILLVIAEGPFWGKQYRILLDLLEEYWSYPGGTVNIHHIAKAREIELGLF